MIIIPQNSFMQYPPPPSGGIVAPGQVTGLNETSSTSTSISLSWLVVAGATSYTVNFNGTNHTGITSTTYTQTGLAASTTYPVYVIAVNSAGAGPASATLQATTSAAGGQTLLSYLQGLRTAAIAGTAKHILIGQHTAKLYEAIAIGAGGGALVTPIPGLSGGKQIAMLGTCNDWANNGGQTDFISVTNAWIAAGGIAFVSQDQYTFAYNSPSDYYTAGTATNTNFKNYLNTQVAKFKQINGTVIWRPLTECVDGNHFGQGFTGPQIQGIFQYMHDYCISQGLNNVLWNFNVNNAWGSNIVSGYYPGNNYVDIVSMDIYTNTSANYNSAGINDYNFFVTTGKPIMMGETGSNPITSQVGLQTFNSSIITNAIKSNFPQIIGCMFWCDEVALVNQLGISTVMNDPDIITFSDLPAGI